MSLGIELAPFPSPGRYEPIVASYHLSRGRMV